MEAFSLSSHIIMWNKAIELSSKSHPGPVVHISDSPMDERKELRTWEEELTQAALQQKNLEELLWCREQELAEQEIDILEWELNIILHQLCQEKPRLKKHMGKFRKKSRLKLKDGNRISLPSGQWPEACWKFPAEVHGAGISIHGQKEKSDQQPL
ncbi:mitogen-activated protein kinase kinase kinase 9-like isoform X3 [Tamandua tetradactyla]|uniref:mitogen-activated protein kinase kinase kinase 9-like isoform X3 n=1 Tax=Tamandua tetradactyla TaxID=48850 RepID=UPI00405472EB